MSKYEDLKERLIKAARAAENDGLCIHMSGNFSICIRNEEKVLITPSGVNRRELTTNDIITADFDGNVVENINSRKPSIELMMHIAVYKSRSDISAVAHTHSPYATAFAVKGIKIAPVAAESDFYGGNTELAEYAPAGSRQLAENVIGPIKKADVCLLKNHGVLAIADTIENALLKASYVEDTAKIDAISRTLL